MSSSSGRQSCDDVAQNVVSRAMVRNHVIHRSSEALQQKCVSGEVAADQACAALPRIEIEHGSFEAEFASISGNPDLEDCRGPVGERGIDDQGSVSEAQRLPTGTRHGSTVCPQSWTPWPRTGR
jgi:hypothetical protein